MRRVMYLWLPRWPIDRLRRRERHTPTLRHSDTSPHSRPPATASPLLIVRTVADHGLVLRGDSDATPQS